MAKKRRNRKQRQPQRDARDFHVQDIVDGTLRLQAVMVDLLRSADPLNEADSRIKDALSTLTNEISGHRPERVIELARMACLPWRMGPLVKPVPQSGVALAELLTLLALSTCIGESDGSAAAEEPNSLYVAADEWVQAAATLVDLMIARQFIVSGESEPVPMRQVAFASRMREVWLRNSSYPDMIRKTVFAMFGQADADRALQENLGFGARDADRVLTALHDMQVERMNARTEHSMGRLAELTAAAIPDRAAFQIAWNTCWQPTADLVAIAAADVAAALDMPVELVESVLDEFAIAIGEATALDLAEAFVEGRNPLRTHPVVKTTRGDYMLVHDALTLPAIRENLESVLKSTPVWERYQKWRGDLAESLTQAAFEQVLPGADVYASFDYFVPANEAEGEGDPTGYTKRVEGDLLLVLDDVAIVVEVKSNAMTASSRTGMESILRRDLTAIITRAAAQAARVEERIDQDGGVRFHKSGWLDLARIREVHTVAVSMEDLPGVATATGDLIAAGLLSPTHVPWTVSFHDLQVIADLVGRPAEFLLYLRRRTSPLMPLKYRATDELDLFLYFFEAGLFVEPDPRSESGRLPHLSMPKPSDIRRYEQQKFIIISSRTDALDEWHSRDLPGGNPDAPKPAMSNAALAPLVDELRTRKDYAWLSTGATLLSANAATQDQMSRIPGQLSRAKSSVGHERSRTIALGADQREGWLLVWATRAAGSNHENSQSSLRLYLQAKKHQLGLHRGTAFVYDDATGNLIDVVFDDRLPIPNAELDFEVQKLRSIESSRAPLPPHVKGVRALHPKKKKR